MSGYSKLFSEIVTSSIWSEDDKTRIVWITMLALKDSRGFVPAALPGLANAARVKIEECAGAVTKLEAPDKYSRTPDNDGRRIKKVDGGWMVLNHERYREKRNDEERREYQRRLMQRRRHPKMLANVSHVSQNVSTVSTMLAHSDTDTEKKEEKRAPSAPVRSPRFVKPTPREVTEYAKSKGINLDGEVFCSFYESNGWKVGRNPMKCWKATITGTWRSGTDNRTVNPTSTRKLFPNQALKLRDEWILKRKAFWNHHARMTAKGEQLPTEMMAEFDQIRAKIKEYEEML